MNTWIFFMRCGIEAGSEIVGNRRNPVKMNVEASSDVPICTLLSICTLHIYPIVSCTFFDLCQLLNTLEPITVWWIYCKFFKDYIPIGSFWMYFACWLCTLPRHLLSGSSHYFLAVLPLADFDLFGSCMEPWSKISLKRPGTQTFRTLKICPRFLLVGKFGAVLQWPFVWHGWSSLKVCRVGILKGWSKWSFIGPVQVDENTLTCTSIDYRLV